MWTTGARVTTPAPTPPTPPPVTNSTNTTNGELDVKTHPQAAYVRLSLVSFYLHFTLEIILIIWRMLHSLWDGMSSSLHDLFWP